MARWPFTRRSVDLLQHHIDEMLAQAVFLADQFAALAPEEVPVSNLSAVEEFVCGQIVSTTRADMHSEGSSESSLSLLLPVLEKKFRKAFHDRLYSVVPISARKHEATN